MSTASQALSTNAAAGLPHHATTQATAPTRAIAGVLSALLGLASLAVIITNLTMGRQTEFLALSLEACGVAAAVVGVLFARGRFQQGPGMSLACIAGTFFTVGLLSGWVALRREMQLANGSAVNLTTLTYARIAASVLIAALGAFEVLSRSKLSLSYLAKAAATGIPLALVGGGMIATKDAIAAGSLLGVSWLTWTAAGMATVALMALACVTIHCVIRAFECGRVSDSASREVAAATNGNATQAPPSESKAS